MWNDLKTGLLLWKRITNLKYVVGGFILFVASGFLAVRFVAPRLYERVSGFSKMVNMEGNQVLMVLALLHILIFGIVLNRIVHETYDRNKDLFYQLAISKKAGCICTMFQRLNWYGYGMVILLAICDTMLVPRWLLIPGYTLLFLFGFCCFYGRADSGVCKRKGQFFDERPVQSKGRMEKFFKSHPTLELLKITVHGLYQCTSLTVCKVILIGFVLYCGNIRMLHSSIFLLADAFLILLNDRYWRNESYNFQYFSEIGIPVRQYLHIHFLAGICFNIAIPLLLFYGIIGKIAMAIVSFGLLSYLLVFWYLVQMYLYLKIERDKEGVIILCSIIFLLMAVLLPVGILMMVWFYKRIARQWREKECSR